MDRFVVHCLGFIIGITCGTFIMVWYAATQILKAIEEIKDELASPEEKK